MCLNIGVKTPLETSGVHCTAVSRHVWGIYSLLYVHCRYLCYLEVFRLGQRMKFQSCHDTGWGLWTPLATSWHDRIHRHVWKCLNTIWSTGSLHVLFLNKECLYLEVHKSCAHTLRTSHILTPLYPSRPVWTSHVSIHEYSEVSRQLWTNMQFFIMFFQTYILHPLTTSTKSALMGALRSLVNHNFNYCIHLYSVRFLL